jgi:hypothetical protein
MGKFFIGIPHVSNLCHEYSLDIEERLVVGQVLETALLKAPLLYLRAGQLDKAVKRLACRLYQTYWYSLYFCSLCARHI